MCTYRVGLNGEDGSAAPEDRELVLRGLLIEHRPARQADDTDLEALSSKLLGSLEDDRDLGTSGDEGEVLVGDLVEDVAAAACPLNGRALEVREVLAGQAEDGRCLLAGERAVVGSGGLVAVGRTPDVDVGGGAEVRGDLDGLVSGTVLTETNGVVGGYPDDLVLGDGGEADGTGGVGDEVLEEDASIVVQTSSLRLCAYHEGTDEGDETAVGVETVGNGAHSMLTDTIADVGAGVVTETSAWWLEVDGTLDTGQVRASEISRTADELREDGGDGSEDDLRELARSLSGVGGLVYGERLLPAGGELTADAAGEFSVLLGELLAVGGEEVVPLSLELGAAGGDLSVEVVGGLGNNEGLLGVEAELRLDLSKVISLERCKNHEKGGNAKLHRKTHESRGRRGYPAAWNRTQW